MRAAEQVPDDSVVRGTLGQALMAQGHHAFAEQALRTALDALPQARNLRHSLVDALLSQGRAQEAEEQLDLLLQQRKGDIRALGLKGQMASARGAHAEAIAPLLESLRLLPAQPRVLDTLLDSWLAQGEVDKALSFLDRLLTLAPRLEFAWGALFNLVRENPPLANDAVKRWRAACPDSAAAAEIEAQASERQGDYEAAVATATEAVERDRNCIGAQLVLARADLRAGQAHAAVARLAPLYAEHDVPGVRVALSGWLGRACDAAEQFDDAVSYWRSGQALAGRGAVAAALRSPAAELSSSDAVEVDPSSTAVAPVLLCGAPGSGVERIAAWLSESSGRRLLGDRFGPSPRADLLQQLVFEAPA
jgi:tetratricopeptide (TPR) repeat protein